MADNLLEGLRILAGKYKNVGARMAKGIMVEYFIDINHDEIVARLKAVLMFVRPKDVKRYIEEKEALPIPPAVFKYLAGFEDWIKGLEPERLFAFIQEASPEIAAAIMEMGDAGAEYMVQFKQFILDNVKALSGKEDIPDTVEEIIQERAPKQEPLKAKFAGDTKDIPSQPRTPEKKLVTCEECKESWEATPEEVLALTECPFCHAPA